MRVLLAAVVVLCGSGIAMANEPPVAPVIQEPEVDGQIVNPSDVHMETAPFSDPDPGDAHLCSDFEIRLAATDQLVWVASCISGLEAIHAHFGDGVFVGSLAGETQLEHDTEYLLRVRHRDDSGDPATEWSDYSERTFITGPATQVFALEGDDVIDGSLPTWIDGLGQDLILPDSADPAAVILETSEGTLLEIQAIAGPVNLIINPPILSEHGAIRVRISPGDLVGGLTLPQSELAFTDHEEEDHTIYLPPMQVPAGSEALYWVSSVGATYVADPGQTDPDFSELAQGIPVPWFSHEPGYKVEIVASGLRLPVNIAFHPDPGPNPDDPLYYVSELYGSIKVVTNGGTVSDFATGLLDFTPTGSFPGSGEQGLTGIVVDRVTYDVIAAMLYDGGGPHYPKVVRYSSVDGGLTASGETILLDMAGESQGQSHQISNLSFGPDGKLYVHMGDGFDASTALNLDSYRGKILRLEPDGSAPTDNPFYDASDGINARDYVYAYGLRNPFGGAWRPEDDTLYEVENGPSTDRFAKVEEGQSFGWNGADFSMTLSSILNWAPAVGPTNIAFVDPAIFGGSLFPADMQGRAFIADSGPTWASGVPSRGKRIRQYELDADGDLVAGPIDFVEYAGTGKATVCGLAAGPDGLYFTDLYKDLDPSSPTEAGANVLRVKFVGAADFDANVTEGLAPLSVSFSDTSTVPSPSSWEWSFGDGNTSAEPNPTHVYTADGIYTVRLTVAGANGVVVEEKPGFIRVGEFPTVALIGSQLPPTAAEETVAEELHAMGFDVEHYDDEPANRPPASVIAADHDLVVIPSTVLSSNIAGEFRSEPVPLITWESALMRIEREPLAGDGTVMLAETAIDLIDDTHPITTGLALGVHDVFQVSSSMSVASAPFAAGAEILATRAGFAAHATLLVAEAGSVLLGGHIAPERRAFLCFEDACLIGATPFATELFRRTVLWSTDTSEVFSRGDCNGDSTANIADPVRLLGFLFASAGGLLCPDACDANDDGALDVADVVFELTSLFDAGTPIPAPTDCGADPTLDSLSCEASPCP